MASMQDSDSSSSEGDEFFRQPIVAPYQFEPTYTAEEVEIRRKEATTTEGSAAHGSQSEIGTRIGDTFWCTCDKCVSMPTETECICCHEVPQAQHIVDKFDPDPNDSMEMETPYLQKCVTLHPDFEAHLNEGVLDTYFRSHRYNWKRFPKPRGPEGTLNNAQYRLVAYRFLLDWILQGERLGKKKRIPLPACLVNAIRTKYPADDGEYVGFRYADLPTV